TSKLAGKPLIVTNNKWFAGSIISVPLVYLLVNFIHQKNFVQAVSAKAPDTQWNSINLFGINFMTDYLLPFEVAGILLLMALIGAAVTASFKKNESLK
ncbi:MAG TPA: NADH-quinone oxidoreductase subunit J, partial [Cyclobacteriaceae bacterium]|nr:NADH-quinone oxidoreductase subunit J [Cyclobacteriaceae bacterium]